MPGLSRRQLLHRLAALAGGAVGAGMLAACAPEGKAAPSQPTAAPAGTEVPPTNTPRPTPEATSNPAVTPPPRPAIISFHPDAPSTVVQTRHVGAWDGGNLVPGALREMLAASITALTGLADARAAWGALFRPHERIAIKVNAFQNSLVWTHVPLVGAVTDALQEAGIPAEQIVIYDNLTTELDTAGFAVNQGGAGVRCYGSDLNRSEGWTVAGASLKLSDVLLGCDALINMPILKTHGMSGISFALKNHYGTIDRPDLLHGSQLKRGMAELNALPAIKDRTRLVIGDALAVCLKGASAWPYWREAEPHDTILVSYDPVAVDTLALQLFCGLQEAGGDSSAVTRLKALPWLAAAAELGVGTNDEASMKVVDLALG